MRKAIFALPLVLALGSIPSYGLDLTAYGFDVTATRQVDNDTVYTVRTPGGFSFPVVSAAPLTVQNATVLKNVVATFEGWTKLKVARAKVIFDGDRADILLVPSSFVYRGVDLSKYLPSGMQFSYDRHLQYDFRILKDNLVVRLKGQLFDESQFAERLYRAVENPVLFLQTNNPEYLLRRLDDLQRTVDRLVASFDQEKRRLAAADSTAAAQRALSVDVQKQLADANRRNAALAEELDRVRFALLVLSNRGLFGRIRPIDRRSVDRVVSMKRAEPSLSVEQIMKRLAAQGIAMSKKEVSLVFDVYFNDFR